ncbi:AraC-like DNA-binding protein [Litorivivens lipolytica]|uniref:AraC-like DNA-binding protein n=1 Tax=Litorivivens lipolytica TaxID=1524264 RepID=A0A7W4W565_9GAMM|nr:AraC family transcriptional regulator [Litorivivens lipolytica]MBB3047696.1 AraC-like DNA-binding protein [Litorivivens lipolytica]
MKTRMNSGLIPLYSIIAAVNQLVRLGFNAEQLLNGSSISTGQLGTDRSCRQIVPFSDLIQVYQNAVKAGREPGIGLKVGKAAGVGVYGVVGFAMLCSSTDIDAVNLAIKYQKAILGTEVQIALQVEGDKGLIRVTDRLPSGPVKVFYLEQFLAGFLRFNDVLAERPSRVCELRLNYPDPGYAEHYQVLFDCPVRFDCEHTDIVFRTDILGIKLPNADPVTARACEQVCEDLLRQFDRVGAWSARVRQHMEAHWREQPGMDAIARSLDCDVRTLRRRLTEEGSSYRSIKDQLRRDIAIERLRSSEIALPELAAQLGFADSSSFRRAFVKWTGRQPGFYRT